MIKFFHKLAIICAIATSSAMMPALAAVVYFGEDLNASNGTPLPNSTAARNSFLSNLTSYGVETFESVATTSGVGSTSTLNFGPTGITGSLGFSTTVRNDLFRGRFPTDGINYLDTSFNRMITFSTPVQAFGLFVIDANELDNDPETVTQNGGDPLTSTEIDNRPFSEIDGIFRIITERSLGVYELLFDSGTFPTTSSVMFAGLIDTANPFTNIILINGTSGLDSDYQDGFGYDGLIVGTAIPEPGTLALLGLCLACLAATRSRKPKR